MSLSHSHLIHVHVGLGPRASLPHDKRKVFIQLTRNYLIVQRNGECYSEHCIMAPSHFTSRQTVLWYESATEIGCEIKWHLNEIVHNITRHYSAKTSVQ